jgi:uncharacterized membrane protein YeaQ/YmgE (transglycosylase-associated protein family)
MRFVKAFFRFWYDFIVGDDWRVAAGVVGGLAISALLVAREVSSEQVIAVLFLIAIIGALLISLRVEAAKHPR